MKKLVLTLVVLVLAGLVAVYCWVWIRAPVDDAGRRPEDVVTQSLEAARAGDLQLAQSFWRGPSTTEHLWRDHATAEERFEEACSYYVSLGNHVLEYGGRDKGKYHVVWMVVQTNGAALSRHPFFMFLEEGQWWIARGAAW